MDILKEAQCVTNIGLPKSNITVLFRLIGFVLLYDCVIYEHKYQEINSSTVG
jgi:hypothetical protein